ncbi:hypothetical protein HNO92_000093 [Chromobacterium alkanivorans]|uniref:hypothetical protein n=1 Tax=Chromobacterium alkanivorans TaxID=1071719 RepID=UPI000ACD3672|nr:hypothetical protein [Chromobacterium alkanivorans]MBN3005946.1 hypothetical protein [Chromobacterium alkanivorans]MCS3802443.1 hypothetical protein [Chromobacterium alkanivorans]MCS3871809.1 hypothetical protein [Chromobacterium alkanivorans]
MTVSGMTAFGVRGRGKAHDGGKKPPKSAGLRKRSVKAIPRGFPANATPFIFFL